MPRLLVIDDRDQTVEMCHRQLPQFDYLTRCDRRIPCQVCEERDRGCPLKCAHDYGEAAEVLRAGRRAARPGDPRPALRPPGGAAAARGQVAPARPSRAARKQALEGLRRTQGLLILERLRQDYPALPVVMLTTTGAELGAERPADPLVYFCENEVVDSRSLAAEITRALALGEKRARRRRVLGREPGDGRAAPLDRRRWPARRCRC